MAEEKECDRLFRIVGEKVGICVGINLKPENNPNDIVNLCFTEIVEKDGEKWIRKKDTRCITADEAYQVGLNLIGAGYFRLMTRYEETLNRLNKTLETIEAKGD